MATTMQQISILGSDDYDGEHDAPGCERGDDDEPSSKHPRSGSLSAARASHIEDMKILALIVRVCDVMELYSPERIGRVCKQHGLVAGPAPDRRTGHDFSKAIDRARAMAIYHEQEPDLVTLSPPCTAISQLQPLNRHVHGEQYRDKHDEELLRAVEHVKFCIMFAKMEIKRHRWFVFEHLHSATTWHEPCMQKSLSVPGVDWQLADQ